jgi:4-amino-4-deoxy-L-arabinose transferase-like glycosyltransferase
MILALAGVLIALSIAVRKLNHDEGQYVAAIELAHFGWPYRDFAYLQTPLQPILLSPLAGLPAGWLLVGARIANGLLGLTTVGLVMLALRGRATPRSTTMSILLLLFSEPFLLACSLARNDALPMAFLAAAILALLRGLDSDRPQAQLAAAGLCLGLASSAKISAAIPAAAAGLFLLIRRPRLAHRSLAAFISGLLVGLLPTFVLGLIAPDRFYFDVFAYSLDAPRQWWTAVGHAYWLDPSFRILRLTILSAQGCILFGLAAAAIDRRRSDDRLLLDLMIIAGLVTAFMPEPAFTQYLVPLLPPVAVRLALAIDTFPQRWNPSLVFSSSICCALGMLLTGYYAVRTLRRGDDLKYAVEQGRAVALAAAGHPIVTLSPERVVGSDSKLERGFVTGPFLFRTSGRLSEQALRLGYSPNWQRVVGSLDADKPSAILTGGESGPSGALFPEGLDESLAGWAATHQYRRVILPGKAVLWLRSQPKLKVNRELAPLERRKFAALDARIGVSDEDFAERGKKRWLTHEVDSIKRRLSCTLSERSNCVQPPIALPNGNSHV